MLARYNIVDDHDLADALQKLTAALGEPAKVVPLRVPTSCP